MSSQKQNVFIMAALMASAGLLTYYFHVKLQSDAVFTHFFYIPIIISSLWWKRNGFIVALFLGALLIGSHFLFREHASPLNNYFRILMFIIVGFVVVRLNEKIGKAEEELRRHRDRLEEVVVRRTSQLENANKELQKKIDELKRVEEALRESEKNYRELSITDALTALYNSRHFFERLKKESERADRYAGPLSLLILDLDDFKHYNDAHGHLEGDKVLIKAGEIISRSLRQTDSAYRYGGEEFAVILPQTEGRAALRVAERIRKGLSREVFSTPQGTDIHVTASIGAAEYIEGEDVREFIKRADGNMYLAKKNGKNRCVFLKESGIVPDGFYQHAHGFAGRAAAK